MPAPPNDPRHIARLLAAMVPDDIAKSIGSAEFNDRIVEAARLSAQAADPALSTDLRKAAKIRAQAVLRAQPRLVTRRQHAELIAKASAAPAHQADALRRQAERLVEELHPIAPGRGAAVRKAKADGKDEPVPVFDADGVLVGICDAADITPVAGKQATTSAPAALAGEPVAKGQRLSVWDQHGRRYVTTRGRIRKTAQPRPGDCDDGPLRNVLGGHDTGYGTGVASPEAQARNRGPVSVGRTTGLGQPRRTGPAAALPGDGPQAALPGDVPGGQVVKSSLGLPFRTLGEAARERRLARIAKATGRDLSGSHVYARNPYSPGGHCVCEAPQAHLVHTGSARQVAKSSWAPGLSCNATEQWLAAQRRR